MSSFHALTSEDALVVSSLAACLLSAACCCGTKEEKVAVSLGAHKSKVHGQDKSALNI
jgi:hypothetical protein